MKNIRNDLILISLFLIALIYSIYSIFEPIPKVIATVEAEETIIETTTEVEETIVEVEETTEEIIEETKAEIHNETIEETVENTIIENDNDDAIVNETSNNNNTYLGNFTLTAYCPCNICCDSYGNNRPVDENGNVIVYTAAGYRAKSGYTIAVDPNIIPYGTEVVINGQVYQAQDCGGAIDGNHIDIYFDTHQDAVNFGRQNADVYLINEVN